MGDGHDVTFTWAKFIWHVAVHSRPTLGPKVA